MQIITETRFVIQVKLTYKAPSTALNTNLILYGLTTHDTKTKTTTTTKHKKVSMAFFSNVKINFFSPLVLDFT